MPASYAHYRFGQQVFKQLPVELQQQISPYMDLYQIGLHGPDLLFYYHPLIPNFVNRTGYGMHKKAALDFFTHAGRVLRDCDCRDAHLAYLYGFICHFALDRACHGYIRDYIAASHVSHTEIETEFDRMLMVHDGKNPLTHRLLRHIKPTPESARVISHFFDGIGEAQILKACRSFIFYSDLLIAPYKPKRYFLYTLFAICGLYKKGKGLMVNLTPDPKCSASSRQLASLYHNAIPDAVSLIRQFPANLTGELPWNPLYHDSFSSERIC